VSRRVYVAAVSLETGYGLGTGAAWQGLSTPGTALVSNGGRPESVAAVSAARDESEIIRLTLRALPEMRTRATIPVFAGLAAASRPNSGLRASQYIQESLPHYRVSLSRIHYNACVASTYAVIDAAATVARGESPIAMALGARKIDRLTTELFRSGRAMSVRGRLQPFAAERDGLLLGDGGSALLLTDSSEDAFCEVLGWGLSGEAYDPVRPEPSGFGFERAARRALDAARLSAGDVDVVNTHGTGTRLNDSAEGSAYQQVFGDSSTTFVATKAKTGHTLEASGAVESGIAALGFRAGTQPGGAEHGTVDPSLGISLAQGPVGIDPANAVVMSVNAAFGGAVAAIVLGGVDR